MRDDGKGGGTGSGRKGKGQIGEEGMERKYRDIEEGRRKSWVGRGRQDWITNFLSLTMSLLMI